MGNVDGIRVRLFDDAESDCGLTTETGDGLFDGRTHLDRRNVPQADGVIARLTDDQVCILVGLIHPPSGKNAEGAFFALDLAGG